MLKTAPGLEAKRADLDVTGILSDAPEAGWGDAMDQAVVQGIPFVNEVVFYHRPSASLILSDLAFNIGSESPLSTREISERLGLTPSDVSRHMSNSSRQGLVRFDMQEKRYALA